MAYWEGGGWDAGSNMGGFGGYLSPDEFTWLIEHLVQQGPEKPRLTMDSSWPSKPGWDNPSPVPPLQADTTAGGGLAAAPVSAPVVTPGVQAAVQTGAATNAAKGFPLNLAIQGLSTLAGALVGKPKTSSQQSAAEQALADLLRLQTQRYSQAGPLYEALLRWGGSLMPTRIGNPYGSASSGSAAPRPNLSQGGGGGFTGPRPRAPLPY